jgi:hypothetical protein
MFKYYDYLQLVDTLQYILKDIYAVLKNNVVIKENVHKEDRTAAKRPLLIFFPKVTGCILWILPWQNEHQWSVNNFWPCILVNQYALWLLKSIYKVWTGFIG